MSPFWLKKMPLKLQTLKMLACTTFNMENILSLPALKPQYISYIRKIFHLLTCYNHQAHITKFTVKYF